MSVEATSAPDTLGLLSPFFNFSCQEPSVLARETIDGLDNELHDAERLLQLPLATLPVFLFPVIIFIGGVLAGALFSH